MANVKLTPEDQRVENMKKWKKKDFDFYRDFFEGTGIVKKVTPAQRDKAWKNFQKTVKDLKTKEKKKS